MFEYNGYKIVSGVMEDKAIVLDFEGGYRLAMQVYKKDSKDAIEGFDYAALYRDNILEAAVIKKPSDFLSKDESGFWSRRKFSQQELAQFMAAATELARKANKDHGKIKEDTWKREFNSFIRITFSSLESQEIIKQGKEKVLREKPARVEDTLNT